MTKGPEGGGASWDEGLLGRLQAFVEVWRSFEGTEQAGAQEFLKSLVDIYDVSFRPGTIFEQHPVKIPARGGKAAQRSLFGGQEEVSYTPERMDMYLPKVCVWEMKGPQEKQLGKHHDQLLAYWSRVRTRYMVLCNFREFWIYDTNDEQGQLAPRLVFSLEELPARGDALLFLRGEEPDFVGRAERVTSDGVERVVDLEPYLRGSVFEPLRSDPQLFRAVRADAASGTIVWPNGADICPDVLHDGLAPASWDDGPSHTTP